MLFVGPVEEKDTGRVRSFALSCAAKPRKTVDTMIVRNENRRWLLNLLPRRLLRIDLLR
jgi:hypothetical protein